MNNDHEIKVNIGKIDMEVLLLNSLILTVEKVEEVVGKFMKNKQYTSFVCFTEPNV